MAPDRGLLTVDTGQPTGQVYGAIVENVDQIGPVTRTPIGVPGAPDSSVPQLAQPDRLVDTPRANNLGELAGQGTSSVVDLSQHQLGQTTIYARCYGAGPIRVTIDDSQSDAVAIPCDDRQHVVPGPMIMRGGAVRMGHRFGHSFQVNAADLTAYRVAVVLDKARS